MDGSMSKNKPKTAAEARRSRNGGGGFLGMEELDIVAGPAVGICSACNRKTWQPRHVGHACMFPSMNGGICYGVLNPMQP